MSFINKNNTNKGVIIINYLGVDGGGTKTEFLIIDENGNIRGHSISKGCHYKQVGYDGFREIIEEGILNVCSKANITMAQINNSFIGIPGYGEIKNEREKLGLIISDMFQGFSYKCGNDAEAGLAGSLACKMGINIVAGTGTIGYGVDKNNKIARAGGWGYFCGDEGSAYWLGKKVIELFTKESDSRIDKSPIYYILKNNLGLTKDFDIIPLIIDDYKMDRGKIAGLAIYLHKAALEKDCNAIEVFIAAAAELAVLADSVIKQLDFDDNDKILLSYSGGVFKSGKFILDPLKEMIMKNHKNIKIIKPILKPVTGAALYAYILDKGTVNEDIVTQLVEHENQI